MAEITLHIKENRLTFFLELIKNFDFVKIDKKDIIDSSNEIKKNIKQGLNELNLIEKGELKTKSADDFLNEL